MFPLFSFPNTKLSGIQYNGNAALVEVDNNRWSTAPDCDLQALRAGRAASQERGRSVPWRAPWLLLGRFAASSLNILTSLATLIILLSLHILNRLEEQFEPNSAGASGGGEISEPVNAPQRGAFSRVGCFLVLAGHRLPEVAFFRNAEVCLAGFIRQSSISIVGR